MQALTIAIIVVIVLILLFLLFGMSSTPKTAVVVTQEPAKTTAPPGMAAAAAAMTAPAAAMTAPAAAMMASKPPQEAAGVGNMFETKPYVIHRVPNGVKQPVQPMRLVEANSMDNITVTDGTFGDTFDTQ
jgi:uncharacterized integral membrane protein